MADDIYQQINALSKQVLQRYQQGEYEQALPLARQVCDLSRQHLGPNHPQVTTSLHNLAALYDAMGNYAAALPLSEQALELSRRVLGTDHPDVATSLNNLAVLYRAMGNYTAAQPLLEQALDLRRRVLGADHPNVATSLSNLAVLYRAMGNHAAALPLYEQALELCRRVLGPDHPNVAASLNNLAELYRAMGNYTAAQPLSKQALDLRRRVLGTDHPDVATSLHNLAMLYHAMGNYAAAQPLYEQALGLRRRVLGVDHPNVATGLNSLAMLYHAMGDYAAAQPLYEQALELRRRVLGAAHPDVATGLNNLAALYDDVGNYAAAQPLYKQALELQCRVLGADHPNVATSLNNLARLYHAMGDYTTAQPLLEQALELRRRVLGAAHPDVATGLNNLAVLFAVTNRPDEGLAHMKEAMAIDDRMLGQIFSCGSENQRMAYLQTIQKNFNIFLSLILQYFPESPETLALALELVLRRKALGAEALGVQREVVLGGQYPALAPTLHHLHLLRMQIAQHTLAGPGAEGLAAHQDRLATWHAEKDQLEAELARQIPEMNLERRLRAVNRQAVALALPEAATLVEFVRFPVLNFHAVPAHGDRQWDPAHYMAFVLPAGDPAHVQMIDLGEAEPIDQMIATYRAHLMNAAETDRHDGAAPESGAALGSALRAALFDPVANALHDGCHNLFLAPDGALSQLPFEVLPLDAGRYLTDTVQITYLSVGRDVLRFAVDIQTTSTAPLVAADPNFDLLNETPAPGSAAATTRAAERHSRDVQRGRSRYQRLPGTAVEGERIAALLGVTPWLADQVMETPLKACRSPRILHLATHGDFLPDQPFDPNTPDRRMSGPGMENPMLRSFLVLAGVNTWMHGSILPAEAEDGMLTAEDVSGMHLLGTELVVLAACHTGRGDVQIGEGVMGLRRAFVLAGDQTLVMSLWRVDDIATAILMEQFYHNLLQGQGRAEQLS